jgi:hypothetical protein
MGWEPAPAAAPTTIGQVTVRARSSRARDEHWDLFLISAEEGPERSAAVFSMTPVSRGTVRASADGPIVDHGFLAEEDAARIAEGVELARRLLGPDVRPGADADVETYVRETSAGTSTPWERARWGR